MSTPRKTKEKMWQEIDEINVARKEYGMKKCTMKEYLSFRPIPGKMFKKVFERDNYICHYCGINTNIEGNITHTIDHIIPRSKNGTNSLKNLVTACRKCNSRKRNKDYKDFIKIIQNEKQETANNRNVREESFGSPDFKGNS